VEEEFQRSWTDGPYRAPEDVDPEMREKVRAMARNGLEHAMEGRLIDPPAIEHPPLATLATQPAEKSGLIAGLRLRSAKQSWCKDQCNSEESERDEQRQGLAVAKILEHELDAGHDEHRINEPGEFEQVPP